jgi:hypothetical protein
MGAERGPSGSVMTRGTGARINAAPNFSRAFSSEARPSFAIAKPAATVGNKTGTFMTEMRGSRVSNRSSFDQPRNTSSGLSEKVNLRKPESPNISRRLSFANTAVYTPKAEVSPILFPTINLGVREQKATVTPIVIRKDLPARAEPVAPIVAQKPEAKIVPFVRSMRLQEAAPLITVVPNIIQRPVEQPVKSFAPVIGNESKMNQPAPVETPKSRFQIHSPVQFDASVDELLEKRKKLEEKRIDELHEDLTRMITAAPETKPAPISVTDVVATPLNGSGWICWISCATV